MTAPIPFTEHEENDFFDDVERQLVALTTAKLDESKPFAHPCTPHPNTVILAQARTHTMREESDDNEIVAMHKGVGSRPAPGVIPASERNNERHRNG